MKKTLTIVTCLLWMASISSLFAQSGAPVWNLPFPSGTTVHVDLDGYNHTPLRRQIMFSEVPGGGGLQVAAPSSGMIHLIPDLEIMGCGDSTPIVPGEKCPPYGMIVEHGNGYFTAYANMDSASVAAAGIVNGSTVTAGQLLGSAKAGGVIGLRKLHFEVYLPTNPTNFVNAANQLIRNIVTVRTRTSTYQYDSHNSIPIFWVGTQQRTVYAGEVLTIGGTSKVNATDLGASSNDLQLFPNPNQGEFTLQIEASQTMNASVVLRDLQGGIVSEPIKDHALMQGTNTLHIAVNGLAAGLYFYQMQAGNTYYQGKFEIVR